jgi:hypothetical protein
MIPGVSCASLLIFRANADRRTWFKSASRSWMILNLLILGTPGIFSSMMSIACLHRSGHNPSASGIDIIDACTGARNTDSSSPRSMHAR